MLIIVCRKPRVDLCDHGRRPFESASVQMMDLFEFRKGPSVGDHIVPIHSSPGAIIESVLHPLSEGSVAGSRTSECLKPDATNPPPTVPLRLGFLEPEREDGCKRTTLAMPRHDDFERLLRSSLP